MKIRQLLYFVAVAEELHFGRAAGRLHVAQPALSRQIKALEQELGTRLFERDRRHVALTAAGRAMLTEAREALAALARVRGAVADAGRGHRGHLRIGYVGSAMMVPEILSMLLAFTRRYPKIRLETEEHAVENLLALVSEGVLDVAIVRGAFADDPLRCHRLLHREPLYVALPTSHPLTRRDRVDLAGLVYPALLVLPDPPGVGLQDETLAAFRRAGVRIGSRQPVTNLVTMVGLVAAGMGIGLVPAAMQVHRLPGVGYHPLADPDATSRLTLVWRRSPINPALPTFLDMFPGDVADAGTP